MPPRPASESAWPRAERAHEPRRRRARASRCGCSSATSRGASSITPSCCSPACAAPARRRSTRTTGCRCRAAAICSRCRAARRWVSTRARSRRSSVARWEGGEARAVAAFLAPAHTACHHAAWRTRRGAPTLPLYAYTAVGWADDQYWTSAFRSDDDRRQDPWRFSLPRIEAGVAQMKIDLPRNRIARQLERCALEYGCRAAQNFFLGRHEGPLPVSIACNAQCVGCISLQPDGEFRASPRAPEHRADAARGGRRGARPLRARSARRRLVRAGLRGRADALRRRSSSRPRAQDPRGGRARHRQPQHQRESSRRGARTLRRRSRRDPRQPELAAPEGLRGLLQPARLHVRRRRGKHRDGGARRRPRVDQPALLPGRHRHRRRSSTRSPV